MAVRDTSYKCLYAIAFSSLKGIFNTTLNQSGLIYMKILSENP